MHKKYGTRLVCTVLAGILSLQLCACGGAGDVSVQQTAPVGEDASQEVPASLTAETASRETAPEAATAEEIKEIVGAVSYDYEQELNIIDDNYRNYYEIFVYSFYDSDGDGIGDLGGVIEKLDYIKDMGFNGIWLMPIMQSTTYHKYDVTDYCSIDTEYGTMEDFERLVEECHKGISGLLSIL